MFVRGQHDEDAEFITLSLPDVYAANILDTVGPPITALATGTVGGRAYPYFFCPLS